MIDTGRVRLALRRHGPFGTGPPGTSTGAQRPVLLVHGLASNARVWDGVTEALGAVGHPVVAVDQRGHGRSDAPPDGYDTGTCADDLADLVRSLGWVGALAPVVAGQSWGGNVVLTLAARHPGSVSGIALVDGGWLRLGARFATFEECWAQLAPPSFDGVRYADVRARLAAAHPTWPAQGLAGTLENLVELPDGTTRARLAREHHRSILHSLWTDDPRPLYPSVTVPALLMPADAFVGSAAVQEAADLLPDCVVSPYAGADHDLHAQYPARCAQDLHDLAVRVDARADPRTGADT